MTENPLLVYHEAYYYFELYKDYLQVHQGIGIIPYPAVLKNDGEKFYFKDIKEIVFYREIAMVEEGRYMEEDKSETVYSCKIKSIKGSVIKIKSLVSWEGRNMTHKTEAYTEFINLLLEKVAPFQAKFYSSTGMLSRVDRAIPALKIGGISIASLSVFSFFANGVMETGAYIDEFFDISYAGMLGILVGGGLFGIAKLVFNKVKKPVTVAYIQNEFLPTNRRLA